MGCCGAFYRKICTGTTGMLLIVIAAIVYPITDVVTVSLLENDLALKSGTLFYENWAKPNLTVYFQFWMWNIKNPEEFQSQNNGEGPYVPPEVEEIGPYSYIESYEKTNIHYENGNYEDSSWIGYKQERKFIFDKETSCSTCDPYNDKITTINIVATAVFGIVNNLFNTRPSFAERKNEPVRECCAPGPPVIRGTTKGCGKCGLNPINQYPCSDEPVPCFGIPIAEQAESFLQNCGDDSEEFIEQYCEENKTFYDYMMAEVNKVLVDAASELVDDTKTVHEILFGFEDPIFGALAKRLKDRQLIDADDEIADVLEDLVYGIFKSKNETSGAEEFRVRNGNGNDCVDGDTNCILKVAEILTWQNKTDLSPWFGDNRINFCNRIEGTDGQSTFPGIKKDTRIQIFVGDICSNIYMDFEKEDFYAGPDGTNDAIPGYFFRTPESVYESKSNPENHCYCSPNLPEGWCTERDGIRMFDQCQFGAPAISSAPHFLSASPVFGEEVIGMNPVDEDHVSYIVYEPTSGSIVRNAKRMQVNFLLTPNPELEFMTLDRPVTMPMFWLNETMQLDSATAQEVYDKSVKPMKIVNSLQYTMFAVGGALVLISLIDSLFCKDDGKIEHEDEKGEKVTNPCEDKVEEETM